MLYLIHGALGSASQLAPLAAALHSSSPATIELAGHGTTPLADRPFSIAGFVEQVIARLDADGVDQADFFGYSMGGYVALAVAAAHPSRVRCIVTLGTKFEWTPEIAEHEAVRLNADKMRAKVPTFADQLTARHAGADGWEAMLANTALMLRALGTQPALGAAELGAIAQPVCIMVGDRDVTVSVEESARVSRLLAAGSLAVLPQTPHPFEQVNGALLASMIARAL
jgi:pimeloyl-ACP methyl ester carboxylesterase